MKIKKLLKKGASLIEVMVAMVIMSLVLSQSFFMQLGAVKLVEGADRAQIASELAQEKLDEYRSIPGEAISEGTLETENLIFDGKKFQREVKITSYGTSKNTKKIEVSIKWEQNGWQRNVDMEGILR